MSPLARPDVLLDVLEEHLEELDFLCEQRRAVLFDADWTLRDLADVEARIEAHVDGLVVGQGHSAELATAALAKGERGLAAAATLASVALADECGRALVRTLPTLAELALLGAGDGLRQAPLGPLSDELLAHFDGASPLVRAVVADVLAFHGALSPRVDLGPLCHEEDSVVRRTALAAAARTGRALEATLVESGLGSSSAPVREATLRCAAIGRDAGLLARCRAAQNPEATRFLGVIGGDDELPRLERALGEAVLAPGALGALGALGTPRAVEVVLHALEDPRLARGAGAAFTRITGADIRADEPVTSAAESEQDDFDDTPAPDPEKAAAFWRTECERFRAARRWQAGRDVSQNALVGDFALLPLATRLDLYLGARYTDPATPLLELETPARDQLRVAMRR